MHDLPKKPLVLTFHQLMYVTRALHMNKKVDVDRLHDIWKRGAPVPTSRIDNPAIYDERKDQTESGNYEARIVIPHLFAQWISDVSSNRGIDIDYLAVYNALDIAAVRYSLNS